MSKRNPLTRNQKILVATLIVTAIGLLIVPFVLIFLANSNVLEKAMDASEAKGRAESQLEQKEKEYAKLKEEMREIDATNHEELLKKYALGYVLFYIDHTNMIIPYESRMKAECILDISEATVTGISDDSIGIELPNIECNPGPKFIRCGYGIRREVGQQTRVFGRFHGIQMYLEMLVDHGDSFICILGFADESSGK